MRKHILIIFERENFKGFRQIAQLKEELARSLFDGNPKFELFQGDQMNKADLILSQDP